MRKDYFIVAFLVIFVMVFLGVFGYRSCSVGTGELRKVRATVTDKGIKRINEEDKYLIYTDTGEGTEVFQITDSLLAGRFDSADVYAKIQVGKTYDFSVRGDRNRFMSWYPNIYEAKEVSECTNTE